MPQAYSQSAQVRSSVIINRWISFLVFGSFSTTDLSSRTDRRLSEICGVTDGKTQWQIATGKGALFEDAGADRAADCRSRLALGQPPDLQLDAEVVR